MPASRSRDRCSSLSADEFRRQMDVNVIGPIIATQAFAPLLGSDPSLKGKRGRIVMISSVAGKNGNPLTPAYAASKHAIEGLSESLRREMMLFGIDVIIVAPGAVKTPIWGKAGRRRHFGLQELAVLSVAGKDPRLHQASERNRTAAGEDRRDDCRGAHVGPSQGALSGHARPDAASDDGGAAQAHGRPDHRQARRADAAGVMSTLKCLLAIAAMAVVASAAYAGDQGDPAQSCDGSTPEMAECLKAQTAQWDKRMTIAYQQAMKDAAAPRREQLRAAQRLWIQYRDANCLYYGMGEGTIARIDAGACMRSMTEARARELENIGHQ